MKQIFVGTFTIGWFNVDLYLMPENDGGCFYMAPDNKGVPRIKVGLYGCSWTEVVNTLIHEALELILTRRYLRFIPTGRLSSGHDSYHFHFDHNEFTEAVSELAPFLVCALPEVETAFRKARRPTKRKGKR